MFDGVISFIRLSTLRLRFLRRMTRQPDRASWIVTKVLAQNGACPHMHKRTILERSTSKP